MMECKEILDILLKSMPSASIEVTDMRGTKDHFEIEVSSSEFQGKNLLNQHNMVKKPLQEAMDDGRIHAVQIKTIIL